MNFIGRWEISCLILNLVLYRSFTTLPRIFISGSGTGAPIAALISALFAFGIVWLLLVLYRKNGYTALPRLAEKYLGRIGKWIVSLVLILYMLISFVFVLCDFSQLIGQIAFPTAPIWFVGLFFVIAATFAVIRGFDAIIRTHVVIVPLTIVLTLAVLLSVFRYAEPDNLFPVLGNGISSLAADSIRGMLLFCDMILLFLINPFPKETKPLLTAAAGMAITVLLIVMFTVTSSYPQSVSVKFPIYQLLKMVYYGRFLQRIDALYMMAITLCGMLYLSVNGCLSVKLISDLWGKGDDRL